MADAWRPKLVAVPIKGGHAHRDSPPICSSFPSMRACRGVLRRAMCTASSSGTRPSHLTTILDVLKRTKDGDLKHVLEKQVRTRPPGKKSCSGEKN